MIIGVQDIAVVLVNKIGDRRHHALLLRALGQQDRAVLVAHCESIILQEQLQAASKTAYRGFHGSRGFKLSA